MEAELELPLLAPLNAPGFKGVQLVKLGWLRLAAVWKIREPVERDNRQTLKPLF